MNIVNRHFSALGCVLVALTSLSHAATVGFQIGTDAVFKNAAGVAFSSTDTTVVAKFGYFASSPVATTAYTDQQIIDLAASPSSAAVNLGNSFVALGSIDFGRYVTDSTSSVLYSGSPVAPGTFIRNWDALNTKPFGFETAGVLNPYLFVVTGSEYLVIKADANTLIPSGIDADTAGAWGINGVSFVNPDDEFDVIAASASVLGPLGSFDAATNSFQTVPEPATGFLLLSSGVLATMLRRASSKKSRLN
jgi:hypothetical protein